MIEANNNNKSTQLLNKMLKHLDSEQGIQELKELTIEHNSSNSFNKHIFYNLKTNKFTNDLIVGDCVFRIKSAVNYKTNIKRFNEYASSYFDDFINLKSPNARANKFINGIWPGFDLTDSEIKTAISGIIDNTYNELSSFGDFKNYIFNIDKVDIDRANLFDYKVKSTENLNNLNLVARSLVIKDSNLSDQIVIFLDNIIDILKNGDFKTNKLSATFNNILTIIFECDLSDPLMKIIDLMVFYIENNKKPERFFDKIIQMLNLNYPNSLNSFDVKTINIFNEYSLSDKDVSKLENYYSIVNVNFFITNIDTFFESLFSISNIPALRLNCFATDDVIEEAKKYYSIMSKNNYGTRHNNIVKLLERVIEIPITDNKTISTIRQLE